MRKKKPRARTTRTERSFAPFLDRWLDSGGERPVLILLAVFVVGWTAFHTITYWPIGLHPDLTEVYQWGRHPMAGYYKHPPLGALMTAAWFSIFPTIDWAFHLLAIANAALALFFVDLIARRYLSGDKRIVVLLLLLLLPFYQFHGQRFASNQTLLATWPLATYCFLLAFKKRTVLWSIAAGLAAALAMLGKYYSIYLVAGFIVAALAHPDRARYLKSPSPWISAATGLVLLVPHIKWLFDTGFQTFGYAYNVHGAPGMQAVFAGIVEYILGCVGYFLLPAAIYGLLVSPSARQLRNTLWPSDPGRRMLVVLASVFLLLPPLSAPFLGVILNSLWTMHAWFLLPIILLAPTSAKITRPATARFAAVMLGFTVFAVLVIAPARAVMNFNKPQSDDRGYYRPLAEAVTSTWHSEIGRRLTIVLGATKLADAIAFYSPDHPDSVPNFNLGAGPWVSAERLASEGWVAVCNVDDIPCMNTTRETTAHIGRARQRTVELTPRFFGYDGQPASFSIVVVPPQTVAELRQ